MLLKDYYKITSREKVDDSNWVYGIEINPSHQIFKGHFPNQPISPGVCNVQMIKECAEDVLGYTLRLTGMKQCKFTSLIIPTQTPKFNIQLNISEGETVTIKAQILDETTKFMDLKTEGVKE